MEKNIKKTVTLCLKLNYTETCNVLKGGIAMIDVKISHIINHLIIDDENDENDENHETEYDFNDISKQNLQVVIKIDEESIKHLEFMRIYLMHKEKNEGKA